MALIILICSLLLTINVAITSAVFLKQEFHPNIYFSDNATKIAIQNIASSNIVIATLEEKLIKHIHNTITHFHTRFRSNETTVIIGGGPVGLLTALEKYTQSSKIVLIEKRIDYERDIWFDLYPEPYSPAYDILKIFGFDLEDIEYEEQKLNNDKMVITIRCQLLERFLSKILYIISAIDVGSIEMLYGYEFIGKKKNERTLLAQSNETILEIPFDHVIGCDGASSFSRKYFGIETTLVNELTINEQKVHIDDLHQTAVILNFKATNGSCPKIRDDPFTPSQKIDPWMPGFMMHGVSSVFKRFYHGHCHLQILFERDQGDRVESEYTKHKSLDWELMRSIVNSVLERMFTTAKELQEALESDLVSPIRVEIRQAVTSSIMLDDVATFSLRGDALANAHFRLGVGVNNAFISYYFYTRMEPNFARAIVEDQWKSMVNYMASTI